MRTVIFIVGLFLFASSAFAVNTCEQLQQTKQGAANVLAVAKAAGAEDLARIAMEQVTAPLPAVYKQRGRINPKSGYRKSTHHCGAYVRVALEKAGLIRKGGLHPSAQARYYGCGLEANGFHNACAGSNACKPYRSSTCTITPKQAPVGSVLVYDTLGCAHPAGHIEIKTSQGYVSDYFNTAPRTKSEDRAVGSCRRLIGIWTK